MILGRLISILESIDTSLKIIAERKPDPPKWDGKTIAGVDRLTVSSDEFLAKAELIDELRSIYPGLDIHDSDFDI